jgi:hypothetical protein
MPAKEAAHGSPCDRNRAIAVEFTARPANSESDDHEVEPPFFQARLGLGVSSIDGSLVFGSSMGSSSC